MKHTYRFLASFAAEQNMWLIKEEELHHLKKVVRLNVEDSVEVFDGQGRWAKGTIAAIEKDQASVLCPQHFAEQSPDSSFSLALGALKPNSVDQLLPSLVELGVANIHVFMQSQVAKSRTSEQQIKRWQKIILAATKQCKRNFLPSIHAWKNLEACIEANFNLQKPPFGIFFSEHATARLIDLEITKKNCFAVIGGEKGLDHHELQLLKNHQLIAAQLGTNILRAYTASIAGAAILSAKLN